MKSQTRIIQVLLELINSKKVSKQFLIEKYQVTPKTIQRDIAIIKNALFDFYEDDYDIDSFIDTPQKGVYQSNLSHFHLSNKGSSFSDIELTSILKVLLASRAFENDHMKSISKRILNLSENASSINHSIANELHYYSGVPQTDLIEDDKHLIEKLELIYKAQSERFLLSFTYKKFYTDKEFKIKPTSVFFKDLYFFVTSKNHKAQDDDDFEELSKFRINNMRNLKLIPQYKPILSHHNHNDRFQVGELFKQTAELPFLGKPIKLIIDFNYEPAYVIDRFPDCKILKQEGDTTTFEIQTNDGYGVKMWLLMQGDMLRVIEPQSMIDYLAEKAENILSYYK